MIVNQGSIIKFCDTNPKLQKAHRSLRSLLYFLMLYFSSQIAVFFLMWPCKKF